MKKIQVLGSGCSKCNRLTEEVKEVAESLGIKYEFEKITDINQIMGFGVMMTPGLVINGMVKSQGTIPDTEKIKTWLTEE
ncbi:MAG: TM0996/MTH895 family glutaredoxin-like protein [Candidatus Marinimicrobia bacterium]|nr:TM0996/MTH895 family glutaredoxin-like protein [Candidatus Neomarinimicrobiota bacterium]MBL7022840.1 TM0996/MTH895 family glutaredoxin-like protein [Candidatus Neomarinimicrobiota bacterium]MBL7109439.1 TM0996/MTH895 family glutaredoxin-like protein [Candidatus Neomarinimicrobiota bacterium]